MNLEELKKYLSYSPETGLFTWMAKSSDKTKLGSTAGCKRPDGYIKIKILGEQVLAHRLAWFYVHGEWPEEEIDHINRVRDDNRLSNLRSVKKRQQQQNQSVSSRNTSGYTGVSKTDSGKYRANITKDGKFIALGVFETPEQASDAYMAAKKVYHELPHEPDRMVDFSCQSCDLTAWAKAGSRLICGECNQDMIGEV
jgi:hypothetical protein